MDWKEEANTLKHKVLTIAFAFQSMQPMWKIIINKKLKKDFQFIFFSIFYLHKSYSDQFTLIYRIKKQVVSSFAAQTVML